MIACIRVVNNTRSGEQPADLPGGLLEILPIVHHLYLLVAAGHGHESLAQARVIIFPKRVVLWRLIWRTLLLLLQLHPRIAKLNLLALNILILRFLQLLEHECRAL